MNKDELEIMRKFMIDSYEVDIYENEEHLKTIQDLCSEAVHIGVWIDDDDHIIGTDEDGTKITIDAEPLRKIREIFTPILKQKTQEWKKEEWV